MTRASLALRASPEIDTHQNSYVAAGPAVAAAAAAATATASPRAASAAPAAPGFFSGPARPGASFSTSAATSSGSTGGILYLADGASSPDTPTGDTLYVGGDTVSGGSDSSTPDDFYPHLDTTIPDAGAGTAANAHRSNSVATPVANDISYAARVSNIRTQELVPLFPGGDDVSSTDLLVESHTISLTAEHEEYHGGLAAQEEDGVPATQEEQRGVPQQSEVPARTLGRLNAVPQQRGRESYGRVPVRGRRENYGKMTQQERMTGSLGGHALLQRREFNEELHKHEFLNPQERLERISRPGLLQEKGGVGEAPFENRKNNYGPLPSREKAGVTRIPPEILKGSSSRVPPLKAEEGDEDGIEWAITGAASGASGLLDAPQPPVTSNCGGGADKTRHTKRRRRSFGRDAVPRDNDGDYGNYYEHREGDNELEEEEEKEEEELVVVVVEGEKEEKENHMPQILSGSHGIQTRSSSTTESSTSFVSSMAAWGRERRRLLPDSVGAAGKSFQAPRKPAERTSRLKVGVTRYPLPSASWEELDPAHTDLGSELIRDAGDGNETPRLNYGASVARVPPLLPPPWPKGGGGGGSGGSASGGGSDKSPEESLPWHPLQPSVAPLLSASEREDVEGDFMKETRMTTRRASSSSYESANDSAQVTHSYSDLKKSVPQRGPDGAPYGVTNATDVVSMAIPDNGSAAASAPAAVAAAAVKTDGGSDSGGQTNPGIDPSASSSAASASDGTPTPRSTSPSSLDATPVPSAGREPPPAWQHGRGEGHNSQEMWHGTPSEDQALFVGAGRPLLETQQERTFLPFSSLLMSSLSISQPPPTLPTYQNPPTRYDYHTLSSPPSPHHDLQADDSTTGTISTTGTTAGTTSITTGTTTGSTSTTSTNGGTTINIATTTTSSLSSSTPSSSPSPSSSTSSSSLYSSPTPNGGSIPYPTHEVSSPVSMGYMSPLSLSSPTSQSSPTSFTLPTMPHTSPTNSPNSPSPHTSRATPLTYVGGDTGKPPTSTTLEEDFAYNSVPRPEESISIEVDKQLVRNIEENGPSRHPEGNHDDNHNNRGKQTFGNLGTSWPGGADLQGRRGESQPESGDDVSSDIREKSSELETTKGNSETLGERLHRFGHHIGNDVEEDEMDDEEEEFMEQEKEEEEERRTEAMPRRGARKNTTTNTSSMTTDEGAPHPQESLPIQAPLQKEPLESYMTQYRLQGGLPVAGTRSGDVPEVREPQSANSVVPYGPERQDAITVVPEGPESQGDKIVVSDGPERQSANTVFPEAAESQGASSEVPEGSESQGATTVVPEGPESQVANTIVPNVATKRPPLVLEQVRGWGRRGEGERSRSQSSGTPLIGGSWRNRPAKMNQILRSHKAIDRKGPVWERGRPAGRKTHGKQGAILEDGKSSNPRGRDYTSRMQDYVNKTGHVPNWSCAPENWEYCHNLTTSSSSTYNVLKSHLGDSSRRSGILPERFPLLREPFLTQQPSMVVFGFNGMTSTGVHQRLLVLYTDTLVKNFTYLLTLSTKNSLTGRTGRAKELLQFSSPPIAEGCSVRPLEQAGRFRAYCREVDGKYHPVMTVWSYAHEHRVINPHRTIFYHGSRPDFDFSLPSGKRETDYNVYVYIKVVDGKGVTWDQQMMRKVQVLPRHNNGVGVKSIFEEISRMEIESPSLVLQRVRALAYELNLIPTSAVSQTIFGNILAIFFYQNCKEALHFKSRSPEESFSTELKKISPLLLASKLHTARSDSIDSQIELYTEFNILKSCARGHLVDIVEQMPVRDEWEVLQVMSALSEVSKVEEYISSRTFRKLIRAMRNAGGRHQSLWEYDSSMRNEVVAEFFFLTSTLLRKQREIFDWDFVELSYSKAIISELLCVMDKEVKTRFLNEKPLKYSSDYMDFHGYITLADSVNKWSHGVPFTVLNLEDLPRGPRTVLGLVMSYSPFDNTNAAISSKVAYVKFDWEITKSLYVEVTLERSKNLLGEDYYYQRKGTVTDQSIAAYEFEVTGSHVTQSLHVQLQLSKILNTKYKVSACVLICKDMQSLDTPLYAVTLDATDSLDKVLLYVPPQGLSTGTYLIVIIDKNAYDTYVHKGIRTQPSREVKGADFLISAWWCQCLVWDGQEWKSDVGTAQANSTWDKAVCRFNSTYTIYSVADTPFLTAENKMNVNELMLKKSYVATYFILLLLLLYSILAIGLQTGSKKCLRRRNVWLRDNKGSHGFAYLLTIKTGTQWNAGTESKVHVILHGTEGMSDTRELQSSHTGQLLTRGSICSFIITTSESLGDIFKVQLWHDNSGGVTAGWYVCEVSVADLMTGASFALPCYKWLAVHADDGKVEREITLESPTTFLQDFEHFLPQYASEHMLWTSLQKTSSSAKFFRLQRLSICLIVCLCLGTMSIWAVQCINTSHTMMTPDLHIEALYYGFVIALALLPVQWLLEMVFKMANRLEEKECDNMITEAYLSTSQPSVHTVCEEVQEDSSDEDDEVYDPEAKIWADLRHWANSVELIGEQNHEVKPVMHQSLSSEGMVITHRRSPEGQQAEQTHSRPQENLSWRMSEYNSIHMEVNTIEETQGDIASKKCSPFQLHLHRFFSRLRHRKWKRSHREDAEGGADEDEEEEGHGQRTRRNWILLFSQCVGWVVCCFIAAACTLVLFLLGSGMPMDYSSLWLQIVYITLCASVCILQPLVVTAYTLYKVCMYRWLGCRGCISSCVSVPLDQVAAVWHHYRDSLLRHQDEATLTNPEKLLEERSRMRELRYAHPPREDYLLKCRDSEIRHRQIYSLLTNTAAHIFLLLLLILIACNSQVNTRFRLNQSLKNALINGSCLDSSRYKKVCTSTSSDRTCVWEQAEDYVQFMDIQTKEDWWHWVYSEMIALTFNKHPNYASQHFTFCDTNSIILGMPRIRKYDVSGSKCEDLSVTEAINTTTCYKEYKDKVSHIFSFLTDLANRTYTWDAHYLAVLQGRHGQYSYTDQVQTLPDKILYAVFLLMNLDMTNWVNESTTRALLTEFTLYHPQTKLYSSIHFLAEFPSLSGSQVTTFVHSTHLERYPGAPGLLMVGEALLLAMAMHYFYTSCIFLFECRLRFWRSFWGVLDVCLMFLGWSYVVCLMLRVAIAEDLQYQLRVVYYERFVNIKGLNEWDEVLGSLLGALVAVQILRCMWLMRFVPTLRKLGHVLSKAMWNLAVIGVPVALLFVCCLLLGYRWFNIFLYEFHNLAESLQTLGCIFMSHYSLRPVMENFEGPFSILGHIYFLVTFFLLYQLTRAFFKAAFIHAKKTYIDQPRTDISLIDLKQYVIRKGKRLKDVLFLKKEVEENCNSENENDIPSDMYMAELDSQLQQVMGRLDDLAESLGIVISRVNNLSDPEDEEQEDDKWCSNTSHQVTKLDGSSHDQEPGEVVLKSLRSSTTFKNLEALLEPLQKNIAVSEDEDGSKDVRGSLEPQDTGETRSGYEEDDMYNLEAFADVASCLTEIESLTRNLTRNLKPPDSSLSSPLDHAQAGRLHDNKGQLAKFLEDVTTASDESLTLNSFGKYGKTIRKLKTGSKSAASKELIVAHTGHCINNAQSSTRHRSHSSMVVQDSAAKMRPRPRAQTHTVDDTDGPVGITGSHLKRTQTQGRGKGNVDFLDIESLKFDEDDSE